MMVFCVCVCLCWSVGWLVCFQYLVTWWHRHVGASCIQENIDRQLIFGLLFLSFFPCLLTLELNERRKRENTWWWKATGRIWFVCFLARRIWAVTSVGSFSSRDFKRRTAASIRARPSTRVAKSWKLTSISPPSVCSYVQCLFTMTRLLYSFCFLLVSSRNHVGGRSDWTIGHFRPTVQGALRRQGQPAGDHRLAEERRWIHYKFVTHSLSLFIVSLVVAPSSSHIWYTYLELVQPTSSLGFISFYRTVVVCSIRP